MKTMYLINYTTVGGHKDFMSIYARNITEAINEFVSSKQCAAGIEFNYSEYAIDSIKKEGK